MSDIQKLGIITRNSTTNYPKVDVLSDAADASDPQIAIRDPAGALAFQVDGNGNMTVPTGGTAAAPVIAFGDGDSGFRESSANRLMMSLSGGNILDFETGGMSFATGTNRVELKNVEATATVPNIRPSKFDGDTGIGYAGADQLALVAGGVEGVRVTEVSGLIEVSTPGTMGVGGAPAASAALDVSSTTGALLLPRMTTVQRDALTAVNGMLIYNTTTGKLEGYEGGAWASLI